MKLPTSLKLRGTSRGTCVSLDKNNNFRYIIDTMKPKSNLIYAVLLWVIILLVIVCVAAYLIIFANGYKINYRSWKIEKTGMIYLKSEPKEVEVWINGELKSDKTPYKYAEIFPGKYELRLVKYGFTDWSYTFEVEPGMVSSNNYIKLFLSTPENLIPNQAEIDSLDRLAQEREAKGLIIKNENEIWFNDVLITRFSQPIKKVVWHPDLKHIFFQIGKEIRIMEPDGSNNTKLIGLESDKVSTFVPLESGKYLLYRDGDSTKKIRLH